MQKSWNGPFDEGRVFNFLVRMREGATAYMYGTYRGASVEEAEPIGWYQKERGARFAADTPGLGQHVLGDTVPLSEAVQDFAATTPGYVVHDSQWTPEELLAPVTSATPGLKEMVRKVIQDPESGGNPWLKRRKERYRDGGGRRPDFLADSALIALGYKDTPQRILDELAPTAEKAFGVFEQARPGPDAR